MCRFFGVSRSGYYDFVRRLDRPEPDAELGQLLREQQAHVRLMLYKKSRHYPLEEKEGKMKKKEGVRHGKKATKI